MPTARERKAILTQMRGPIIQVDEFAWTVKGRARTDPVRKTGDGQSAVKRRDIYLVQCSADGQGQEWTCNCPAGLDTLPCRHVDAVRKTLIDGPPKEYGKGDETKRPTYPQDNVLYRIVREITPRAENPVLQALARTAFPIGTLRKGQVGHPFGEISDMVLCIVQRIRLECGGLEAQSTVVDLFDKGYLFHQHKIVPVSPSVAAITLAMRRKHIYEAFQKVIEASNEPLKGKKEMVAVDGSEYESRGLQTPENAPTALAWASIPGMWYKTVKLHAAIGVESGMFLGAFVTPGKTHDSIMAIDLIEQSRKVRFVDAILGDKAYLSTEILTHLDACKIAAKIPAKSNNVVPEESEEWTILAKHVRAWRRNEAGLQDGYGKRSLVEAQFSRDKRLNGDWLRSGTMEGLTVELLAHILLQNVRRLIYMYVAGEIDLAFLDDRAKAVLDPARAAAKDRPTVDRSPRFRDGLDEAA